MGLSYSEAGWHLFSQQSSATALDHVQQRVHLVGSVYGQVELRLLCKGRERNPETCVIPLL